jgi:pimeloyl-ACP methyl ester carboxylesterase
MPRLTPKQVKRSPQPTSPPEVVHPIWLVKAVALTILAALICGYLTLCLLFYQGQWQFALHPSRNPVTQPIGEVIHFAPDESAVPQLTGQWIPAAPSARYAQNTILLLPSGDGNLADFNSLLNTLHNLGINVFAFDYRGYGPSANTHPNQQRMLQDANSAWQYLTTSRTIPARQIIPYGVGVGASLATNIAATHPEVPALILESPHADLLNAALSDPRSRFLPIRLLFHEHFPLAEPLATLRTPKLLIINSNRTDKSSSAFRTAADPKLTVEFPSPNEALYTQTLNRFLDQYLQLVPSPAPSSTIPH